MEGFYFLIAGMLAMLGILIHKFKCHFLIAGYNMMSREERKDYDAELLGKHTGITLYILSALSLAAGFFLRFFSESKQNRLYVITIYIILTMITVSSLLVKENKKNINEVLPLILLVNAVVLVILSTVIFAG